MSVPDDGRDDTRAVPRTAPLPAVPRPVAVPAPSAGVTSEGSNAARGPRGGSRKLLGGLVALVREVALVLGMALVLSFVVKTWLLQAFYIPSGSMEDTLLVGDRVVVSKLSPGPIDLSRGDVVVFEDPGGWLPSTPAEPRAEGVRGAISDGLRFVGLLPSESEDHLIKRVVGLPGDHVVCCDAERRLLVNDVPLEETYLKPGDIPSSLTFDVRVPADRVWVMGDHRSDSEDSRFHDPAGTGAQGSVPVDRVTGRAVAVVWPLDRLGWISDHSTVFSTVPAREPAG